MPRARSGALAALLVLSGCASGAGPRTLVAPMTPRQIELVRFVRQDCGACHGMRLTGGLGPAITVQALAGQTSESVSATILDGHPGTPMPGWRGLLTEADARWIAARLLTGFPEEP
jgi:cytochrome c55X